MNNMLPLIMYVTTCLIILGGSCLLDRNERLAIGLMVFGLFAMFVDFIVSLKIHVAQSPALKHLLQQGVPLFFVFLMILFASWLLLDTTDDIFSSPGGGSNTLFKGVAFILGIGLLGALATWLVYL